MQMYHLCETWSRRYFLGWGKGLGCGLVLFIQDNDNNHDNSNDKDYSVPQRSAGRLAKARSLKTLNANLVSEIKAFSSLKVYLPVRESFLVLTKRATPPFFHEIWQFSFSQSTHSHRTISQGIATLPLIAWSRTQFTKPSALSPSTTDCLSLLQRAKTKWYQKVKGAGLDTTSPCQVLVFWAPKKTLFHLLSSCFNVGSLQTDCHFSYDKL